jgi:four helix bundle protein
MESPSSHFNGATMTYSRFEDLPVWKAAVELKLDVDDLCEHPLIVKKRNWIDQIDRASLSVSNNIAEGFERGSTNELLMFLYIARGSAGETRSMLRLMCRKAERRLARLQSQADQRAEHFRSQISNLKSTCERLISACESVSRQIRAWADSLQNSDIAGQRHLNDQTRRDFDQRRRSDTFWRQIRSSVKVRFETSTPVDEDGATHEDQSGKGSEG